MGCHSATVELRGEADVTDELASKDANGIIKFLKCREYIKSSENDGLERMSLETSLSRPATPLSGVDMIEASVAGVLVYTKELGVLVEKGEAVGYILCPVTGEETPIISSQSGIFFARRLRRQARPGSVIAKISGTEALKWRAGGSSNSLLTSR